MVSLCRILLVALQKQFKDLKSSSSLANPVSSIREAVRWLEQYDQGDHRDAYFHLLRRCISAKAADEGRRLHSLIRKRRYDYDGFLGTLMIRVYSACGSTYEARNVYETLPGNSMLALHYMLQAYISNAEIDQARELFDSVSSKDEEAWNIMLQAYAAKGEMMKAYRLFRTSREPGVDLWMTMIRGYARAGSLEKAREIFKRAPGNERCWSAMIAANAEKGELDEARKLLAKMRNPSLASCKSLFDAYLRVDRVEDAQWAFNRIGDVYQAPWIDLLNVYLQRDRVSDAEEVFRIMPDKTSDAWNLMIAANAERGQLREATELFEKMGSLKRNLASWNSVMTGYARHGRGKDALKIFRGMKDRGVKPNRESFEIIITGAEDSDLAQKVSREVEWSVFVRDVKMNNLVLGMFARVGSTEEIQRAFQRLEVRNQESWSLLLLALSRRGMHEAVKGFVAQMIAEKEKVESSTLRELVQGCKSLELAVEFLKLMVKDFGVNPELEDCVCVMKLLKPNELQAFIRCLRFDSDPKNLLWEDLIEVCKKVSEDTASFAEKSLAELLRASSEDSSVQAQPAEESRGLETDDETLRKQASEDRSRMVELEDRARRSRQKEARSVPNEETHQAPEPGWLVSGKALRSSGLDLEKFWIGE